MPALMLGLAGKSTYTSALRVTLSTVGAIMRTLPVTTAPLAAVTVAVVPGLMPAISELVTSARHSSRPPRIILNSSVPLPTTAPTVALRLDMTPLSGATTPVCFKRTCCTTSMALAASSLALAVLSAVVYWLICCSLSAPLACNVRALSALPAASSAVAWASAKLAWACATSALTCSVAKLASTCPLATRSPTLTLTSTSRSPLASLPMMASCQATTVPLAGSLSGRLLCTGCTVVTVSAALAGAAFLSSAAPDFEAKKAVTPNNRAQPATEIIAFCLLLRKFMRFMCVNLQ